MNTTFAMWRKSLSQLIMMKDKKEWDALDILSKWFIATRSAVGTITLYSGLIGGLLAWQYLHANNKPFTFIFFITWVILTIGLFIAHGSNNLINDYTDFSRGIDKDNYFRTQYGVHPLAQGFWDKRTHLIWFGVSGFLAVLSGIYAMLYTHFSPIVVGLFVLGALILLFYTYPLKYVGIGELSIFIIWGPLMIGGVFFVLTGLWSWAVILASIPVGLNVVTINLGKHTDKRKEDLGKGVRTLPVSDRRDGFALCDDLGDCVLVSHHNIFDLCDTLLHADFVADLNRYSSRMESNSADVETASGCASSGLSDLAALVLDSMLCPQPRVQQLLCAGTDHRYFDQNLLPPSLGSFLVITTTKRIDRRFQATVLIFKMSLRRVKQRGNLLDATTNCQCLRTSQYISSSWIFMIII